MTKNSVKYSILICVLGYLLIIASVIAVSIIVKLITGYYPSFTFFTLALITFRLIEIHQVFLIAPLSIAILVMMVLSKILNQTKIVAGLSMTSYYLLVTLIFLIIGGEFPFELLLLWLPWTFFLGFVSPIIVEKLYTRF